MFNTLDDNRRLLPNGLNPIAPELMDPIVLGGGVRFNVNDEDMDDGVISDEEDAALLNNGRRRQRQQARQNLLVQRMREVGMGMGMGMGERGQNRPREPLGCSLDLNLPLLQLFIATLFPWVQGFTHDS